MPEDRDIIKPAHRSHKFDELVRKKVKARTRFHVYGAVGAIQAVALTESILGVSHVKLPLQ